MAAWPSLVAFLKVAMIVRGLQLFGDAPWQGSGARTGR
jgi:hypothetical protein